MCDTLATEYIKEMPCPPSKATHLCILHVRENAQTRGPSVFGLRSVLVLAVGYLRTAVFRMNEK